MKALLVAVNAKYIHTSLSVRTLKAYANSDNVEMAEYTINERVEDILRSIFLKKADVVLFSCYIWNVEVCLDVADMLKKVSPETKIIFGGPEVSFDDTEYMQKYDFIDAIMRGEGEATFKEWLEIGEMADGITYRENGEIIRNKDRELIHDITSIPFPYTDEDIEKNSGKLIYYESSRGCPFRCSYCLSSTTHSVRFRDMDVVKEELMFFVRHNVRIVKFVDRTFNADRKRTCELVKFLIDNAKNTTFHFEVAADLINDELVELFKTAPEGLFQLEIGVQSTNPKTIKEIHRVMDFEKVSKIVRRIQDKGNVHEHLDLIAGLPYEDVESFAHSFDDVYALKPEQLQLGFLKVLKGSFMQEHQEEYGIVHKAHPPYEVLYTKWISYEDVLRLKGIEEMVEVYYNSRQFTNTMEELEKEYDSAFTMYDRLASYYEDNGYNAVQHKRSARYEILLNYIRLHHKEKEDLFREVLTYDYYLRENAKSRPEFAGDYLVEKNVARAFYEKEEETHMYLPDYGKYDRNQMRKMTHLEYFKLADTYILFDYQNRNPLNQEARVCKVEIDKVRIK